MSKLSIIILIIINFLTHYRSYLTTAALLQVAVLATLLALAHAGAIGLGLGGLGLQTGLGSGLGLGIGTLGGLGGGIAIGTKAVDLYVS